MLTCELGDTHTITVVRRQNFKQTRKSKVSCYCCVIFLYDCSEHMDMGVSDYMSVLSC